MLNKRWQTKVVNPYKYMENEMIVLIEYASVSYSWNVNTM